MDNFNVGDRCYFTYFHGIGCFGNVVNIDKDNKLTIRTDNLKDYEMPKTAVIKVENRM